MKANWSYPTSIRFGSGRLAELPEACRDAGIKRPLLVTDRMLAGLEITAAALDVMEDWWLGRSLFSDVDPNPTDRNLEDGSPRVQAGGFEWRRCIRAVVPDRSRQDV